MSQAFIVGLCPLRAQKSLDSLNLLMIFQIVDGNVTKSLADVCWEMLVLNCWAIAQAVFHKLVNFTPSLLVNDLPFQGCPFHWWDGLTWKYLQSSLLNSYVMEAAAVGKKLLFSLVDWALMALYLFPDDKGTNGLWSGLGVQFPPSLVPF